MHCLIARVNVALDRRRSTVRFKIVDHVLGQLVAAELRIVAVVAVVVADCVVDAAAPGANVMKHFLSVIYEFS